MPDLCTQHGQLCTGWHIEEVQVYYCSIFKHFEVTAKRRLWKQDGTLVVGQFRPKT